jgi:hypothetical protein
MTKLFDIHIGPDRVVMLHKTIMRPSHVSPSEWMNFWEESYKLLEQDNVRKNDLT